MSPFTASTEHDCAKCGCEVTSAVATYHYRSPSSGSVAAATTPARLAEEFHEVRWRELPGGGIEVALRHEDQIQRLRVHDDGSTSHMETLVLRSTRWATTVGVTGMVVGGVSWVGILTLSPAFIKLFFAGMALAVVGWLGSLPNVLGCRPQLGSGWHEPTKLNGWMPRTSAQLGAVEAIAERHEGLVLVRDIGAATVDVCASSKGRLAHYVVAGDGFTTSRPDATADTTTVGSLARRWPLLVVLFGLIVGSRFGVPGTLVGVVLAFAAVAWLAHEAPLERLRRSSDGIHWIEIRTRVVDND